MGYYMRFISTDENGLTLAQLDSVLKQSAPAYSIQRDNETDLEGILSYGNDEYGQIELNLPGDGLFEEEIQELIDFVSDANGPRKTEVLDTLKRARAIVAVRILFQDRATEATLSKLDPLWDLLLKNREGLLQAARDIMTNQVSF